MKFGFCTSIENYHRLVRIGYDYIELSGTSIYQMSDTELYECKHIIDNGPVKCENLNNFIIPDEGSIEDYVNKVIRRAHLLKVKTICFEKPLSKIMSLECTKEKSLKQGHDFIEMALEASAPYGIRILIGVVGKSGTKHIKDTKEAYNFIKNFKQGNVGLVLDLGHFWNAEDELEQLDKEIIKHAEHMYIANEDNSNALEGSRTEKYKQYIKYILSLGYKGNLSYKGKVKNFESEARETLELLRKIYLE